MVLRGKKILVGVTGSIAAFKVGQWVHDLSKEGAQVTVVMTKSAARFVSPLTFSALSGNDAHHDMFAEQSDKVMAHINLGRDADLILVAPATAQSIARCAFGMADDLLSAVILAADCPVIFCPAMNTHMYEHPATQKNLERLQEYGYGVVDPEAGMLACGDSGPGRLASWDTVHETLIAGLTDQDLAGEKILITAGPTREALDPARYLSNRSSGKMGYALARTARRRGASVTLISGPVSLCEPPGVKVVPVSSAEEMADAVLQESDWASIIVKAAAVADYRPSHRALQKIKKTKAALRLDLEPTKDILQTLGRKRNKKCLLIGFAAESEKHLEAATKKFVEKNVDLMVLNDILGKETGFDVDTNQVVLIDNSGSEKLPLLSKEETAHRIWDKALQLKSNEI